MEKLKETWTETEIIHNVDQLNVAKALLKRLVRAAKHQHEETLQANMAKQGVIEKAISDYETFQKDKAKRMAGEVTNKVESPLLPAVAHQSPINEC